MEYGITKLWGFKDTECFRLACSCGSQEHDIDVWIENDNGLITLTFYANVTAKYFCSDSWYKALWWRIKTAVRILFVGSLEMQHDFYFKDKEHINGFLSALSSAKLDPDPLDNHGYPDHSPPINTSIADNSLEAFDESFSFKEEEGC